MEAVVKDLPIGCPKRLENPEQKKHRKTLLLIPKKKKGRESPDKESLLPTRITVLTFIYLMCLLWSPVGGIHLLKQPGNLWVTWANQTGNMHFCLTLQSTASPFQACLIGIDTWDTNSLQWLSPRCLTRAYSPLNPLNGSWVPPATTFNVSRPDGSVREVYCRNYSRYNGCVVASFPKGSGIYAISVWNNNTAKALPPGIFLVCGDRAWQGIPRNAIGEPCYLGSLTILSPNITEVYKALNHT
ncbi:uncharacterized protein LOC107309809 [Coturnix japonica]|uniref:uncharacterized protein LOC107309809 n=1 Tax=Coturnix japonica TaxID=93934 RepID=UPI000777023D|nr:uncharacterized protein LOC107309809 [Coturnix japonica]